MRVIKFAKIDFLKTKSFSWALLFPIVAVLLLVYSEDGLSIVAYGYCLFAGIIFSAMPFSCENQMESGFLEMLPCKPGDAIRGHFSYCFFILCIAAVCGIGSIFVGSLLNPEIKLLEIVGMPAGGIYRSTFTLALLIAGIQNVILSLFRYDNVHVMQLLRMAPGFLFFFGMNALMGEEDFVKVLAKLLTARNSWVVLLVGILVYCLMAQIGAVLAARKE